MKMRRGFAVLLVLLCGITLWGCSNNNRVEIKAHEAYFAEELWPFAFTTTQYKIGGDGQPELDENGKPMPIDLFKLEDNDHSYLEFGDDFQKMWIVFANGTNGLVSTENGRVEFIITSGAPKDGNIRGTASRIINDPTGVDHGKLVRYSFWSDKHRIYMRTLVSYNVGTEVNGKFELVSIPRDVMVAEFARHDPWIVGGDA